MSDARPAPLAVLVRRAERRRALHDGLRVLSLAAAAALATLAAGVLEGHAASAWPLVAVASLAGVALGAAWLGAVERGPRAALSALEAGREAAGRGPRGELTTAWELVAAGRHAPLERLAVATCEARTDAAAELGRLARPSSAWLALPLAAAAVLALVLEGAPSDATGEPRAGGGLAGGLRGAIERALDASGSAGDRASGAAPDVARAWVLSLAEGLDPARVGADAAERAWLERELARALAGLGAGEREAVRAALAAAGIGPGDDPSADASAAAARTGGAVESGAAEAGREGRAGPGLAPDASEGRMGGSQAPDSGAADSEDARRSGSKGEAPTLASAGLLRGRSWPLEVDEIVVRWLARER